MPPPPARGADFKRRTVKVGKRKLAPASTTNTTFRWATLDLPRSDAGGPAPADGAAAVAALLGAVTLRLGGHFLPLGTIAWGLAIYYLFGNIEALGGHNGQAGCAADGGFAGVEPAMLVAGGAGAGGGFGGLAGRGAGGHLAG